MPAFLIWHTRFFPISRMMNEMGKKNEDEYVRRAAAIEGKEASILVQVSYDMGNQIVISIIQFLVMGRDVLHAPRLFVVAPSCSRRLHHHDRVTNLSTHRKTIVFLKIKVSTFGTFR